MSNITKLATLFELDKRDHSDVLLELESLCRLYTLSPEDLKYKWEAFAFSHNNISIPTVDRIRQFQTTLQRKFEQTLQPSAGLSQRSRIAVKQRQPDYNLTNYMDVDENMGSVDDFVAKLTSGGGISDPSNNGSSSSKNIYPVRDHPAESSGIDATIDMDLDQSAQLYSRHTHHNSIDAQYNSHLSFRDKGTPTESPTVQLVQPSIEKYRYMFEKLRNKAEVLDDRIDYIASVISDAYKLENEFGDPNRMTQEPIVAIGRVCCDTAEGKLNDSSILLETSRSTGMGKRVKLDISKINEYTLFPGQVIAVEGTNISGKCFTVDKILTPPLPDPFDRSVIDSIDDTTMSNTMTQVFITAGPYTLDGDLSFTPLEELLTVSRDEQPDVLILMGPFLSCKHPFIVKGQVDQLPEDIFRTQVATKLNHFAQSQPKTQVLLIPHADDIIQEWPLFPQPSLPLIPFKLLPNIRSLSNPAIIDINRSIFAIANVDILRSMSNQEISKNVKSERLVTLSQHILSQQNFYPLFPTSLADSIDADQLANLQISGKPDFSILPSQLKTFVKLQDDVLFINPGYLSRGRSTGSFVKVVIHPDVPNTVTKVHERTRVDLVKL